MKPEVYAKIAEKYKQKYESYGESSGASSFRDVRNLVWNPDRIQEIFATKTGDERKQYLRWFNVSIKSLRTYFRLLDSNAEFREAELHGDEPKNIVGFPDIMNYSGSEKAIFEQEEIFGYSPARKAHYILLSKQRLEDIANDS